MKDSGLTREISAKQKRSRAINLDCMRKVTADTLPLEKTAKVSVVAATVALAACAPKDEAIVLFDERECQNYPDVREDCRLAYLQAKKQAANKAPRYANRTDCEADFGYDECESYNSTGVYSSSGYRHSGRPSDRYRPRMAGFAFYRNKKGTLRSTALLTSTRHNSPFYNQWSTLSGQTFGKKGSKRFGVQKIPRKAFNPQKTTRGITKRGGFGRTVSARGSFGG